MMQRSDEKLCLQWNDFQENLTSAFRDLRDDKEFTDITLVCEDGEQVEAHKVILAASSPFLKELLRKHKHPHPLMFMRALKSEDLIAILDFLYFGEANVFQENLHSFLLLAQELKLKGLTTVADEINKHQKFSRDQKFKRKSSVEIKSSPKYQEISSIKEESSEMKSESFSPGSHQPYPNFDTTDTLLSIPVWRIWICRSVQ